MSNASDFVIDNGILNKYIGAGGDVVIPDNVTVIGEYAFERCKTLQTVTISDSVTKIGIAAFSDCKNLTVVKMGSSVIDMRLPFHGSHHVTIHAPAGSSAETYAKEHNIPFVAE